MVKKIIVNTLKEPATLRRRTSLSANAVPQEKYGMALPGTNFGKKKANPFHPRFLQLSQQVLLNGKIKNVEVDQIWEIHSKKLSELIKVVKLNDDGTVLVEVVFLDSNFSRTRVGMKRIINYIAFNDPDNKTKLRYYGIVNRSQDNEELSPFKYRKRKSYL